MILVDGKNFLSYNCPCLCYSGPVPCNIDNVDVISIQNVGLSIHFIIERLFIHISNSNILRVFWGPCWILIFIFTQKYYETMHAPSIHWTSFKKVLLRKYKVYLLNIPIEFSMNLLTLWQYFCIGLVMSIMHVAAKFHRFCIVRDIEEQKFLMIIFYGFTIWLVNERNRGTW